jgi:hypothetical protein
MSEMLDKIKEILEKHNVDTSGLDDEEREVAIAEQEPIGPLEEALYRALYSLEEIRIYGQYGRAAECSREAADCLEKLTKLQEKWVEQTQMMDALTAPVETTGGYA